MLGEQTSVFCQQTQWRYEGEYLILTACHLTCKEVTLADFELCWSVSSMEKVCLYRTFWFWCLQNKSVKEKVITRIIVSRCEVDLMKVRAEFKRNFGKSLYQTILVSFHLSLFFLICSVIYLSILFFLLLVCLYSRSILIRMFLFVFFSSGAHQGWLPESSTEPLWRRWLNICNLLLHMSSSEDFLKRLVKNAVLL